MAPEVTVRAATAEDARAMSRIYAPFVTDTATSFEETPPDSAELARRMQAQPRLPWLVVEVAGDVAGYAYASTHRGRPAYRWSVESSVYLDPNHSRRGLGRLLYSRLFEVLRGLGYVTVLAGITEPNPTSVGFHEALGFEPVGTYRDVGFKAGQWRSVSWWQRRLAAPPSHPPEPIGWDPGSPGL